MIEEKMLARQAEGMAVCPTCHSTPHWGIQMEDADHSKLIKKFRVFCDNRGCPRKPTTEVYTSEEVAKTAWNHHFFSYETVSGNI